MPQLGQLKEYIEYYYFMTSDDSDGSFSFVYYPHYNTTLNIFRNSQVSLSPEIFSVSYDPRENSTCLLSCDRRSFKRAQVIGPYDIIGVIFKPLGMNRFFDTHIENPSAKEEYEAVLTRKDSSQELSHELFAEENLEKRVEILDQFLIERIRTFKVEKLDAVIQAILDSEGQIQIQELEAKFAVNRRTLLRWFKKYIYCSLTEFKNIVKFRRAIDKYQSSQMKLGSLSYESNYYDQSDFISHFKSLTGELPKRLLEHVQGQEEQPMFWKL